MSMKFKEVFNHNLIYHITGKMAQDELNYTKEYNHIPLIS